MLSLMVRPHQLESRTRENRPSGSEGGVALTRHPYPYLTLPASLDFCRLCVGGVSGCARATTMNRRRLQAETIARIPGPNNPSGAAQFLATHREPLRFGARSVPLRSVCATTIALGPIHGALARVAAAA